MHITYKNLSVQYVAANLKWYSKQLGSRELSGENLCVNRIMRSLEQFLQGLRQQLQVEEMRTKKYAVLLYNTT